MIRFEIKSYKTALTKEQQKYLHYHMDRQKIDENEYLKGEEILIFDQH